MSFATMSWVSPVAHGGAFTNCTNVTTKPMKLKQRKVVKSKEPGFPLPSTTRKSAPTCTVSLAFAGASHRNGIDSTSSSTCELREINLIPFPSSSSTPFPTGPASLSESDAGLSEAESGTSTNHCRQSPQAGWQRRRSNACLPQIPKSRSSSPSSRSKSSSSSTRKRARKVTKRLNADLQFLTLLQRSVAWRLAERGMGLRVATFEVEDGLITPGFEVQDMVLVTRLRSYLVSQGCKPGHLELEVPLSNNSMAEDSGSFEMDVDLAVDLLPPCQVNCLGPAKVAPMSSLVASLILRHKERSALRARSVVQPDTCSRPGLSRVVSPLALCANGDVEY